MKLILIRHGETEGNKSNVWQGQTDTPLSKKGVEQTERLASRLKDEKIDIIYSSDLGRAIVTAETINKFHKVPIETTNLLRCRFVSDDFIRKPKNEDNFKTHPDHFESIESLFQRAKQFYETLYEKHKHDTLLIVAHNTVIKSLTALAMNKSLDEIKSPTNTGVTIIELGENKDHKVHLINCTKHLK